MHLPCPWPTARRLAALALLALAVAPVALAAPSADDLRAARDAVVARDAIVQSRVAREQAALATGRARLDRARLRHQRALRGLNARLTALYVSPDPSPVIEILTGGDLGEAQARIDLLEALGRRDRSIVREYRVAAADLRAAEADIQRRKDVASAQQRDLDVERQVAESRLETAARREAAAAAAPVLTITTPSGLPVTDDGASAGAGSGTPTGRGLAQDILDGRGLPGEAPVDAATGMVVDADPMPAGPVLTRALPGIGATGPGSGAPVTDDVPTFRAVAAWYGPGFDRVRLASGETYDPAALSAASRTMRLGTLLRISYGARAVTVRVNDRGPYIRGRDLDLSQAAAAALGLPGVATVTVQVLPGYAPPRSRAQ